MYHFLVKSKPHERIDLLKNNRSIPKHFADIRRKTPVQGSTF